MILCAFVKILSEVERHTKTQRHKGSSCLKIYTLRVTDFMWVLTSISGFLFVAIVRLSMYVIRG